MTNYPHRNIAEIHGYAHCDKCGIYSPNGIERINDHACKSTVVNWQETGFATHNEYVAAKKVVEGMNGKQLSEQDKEYLKEMKGRIRDYRISQFIERHLWFFYAATVLSTTKELTK